MPEIGTSGSMSGDGKRSVAAWPKLPRPSSTLPEIGPHFQVIERIDNTPADFSILRAGAVGAVFLECAARQAEIARSLGCAKKAWRQPGQRIGHGRSSVMLWRPTEIAGESEATMSECVCEEGW